MTVVLNGRVKCLADVVLFRGASWDPRGLSLEDVGSNATLKAISGLLPHPHSVLSATKRATSFSIYILPPSG